MIILSIIIIVRRGLVTAAITAITGRDEIFRMQEERRMGISTDEMNALMQSHAEDRDRNQSRRIRLGTQERRKKERRKANGSSGNFLGMDRRISVDRRANNGKSRIPRGLE